MPILHVQIGAQAKTPDGKVVPVPPPFALQMRGPVLQVSVTIEQNAAQALLQQGKEVPTPKPGWALIDTRGIEHVHRRANRKGARASGHRHG